MSTRRRSSGWTCRRQTAGVICRHENRPRTRICAVCGKHRPERRRPAHMDALKLPYEHYIAINGGKEECGICGKARQPGEPRLHRDHDHRTGRPRGLLDFRCNAVLRPYVDEEWLRRALAYVERAA